MRCLIIFFSILTLGSCVNTKRFSTHYVPRKGMKVYKNSTASSGGTNERIINEFEVKGQEVLIVEEDDHLKIEFATNTGPGNNTKSGFTADPGTKILSGDGNSTDKIQLTYFKKIDDQKTYYHFPADTITNFCNVGKHYIGNKFTYYSGQPVFQTISVPFKFRGEHSDSIPATIGTSVNAGFAFGYKWTKNKFSQYYSKIGGKYKHLSNKMKNFSFSGGGFLGPTVIALENGKNVKNEIDVDHSEIGLTTGVFTVVGAGQFNLGLALGFDLPLGRDGDEWIYSGKPWWGLVIGLDFVK